MESILTPKVEALISKVEDSPKIKDSVKKSLGLILHELKNAKEPNIGFIKTKLELAYGVIYIDRENAFSKSKADPKESDPAFKLLTEVMEAVNDCIELVIDNEI